MGLGLGIRGHGPKLDRGYLLRYQDRSGVYLLFRRMKLGVQKGARKAGYLEILHRFHRVLWPPTSKAEAATLQPPESSCRKTRAFVDRKLSKNDRAACTLKPKARGQAKNSSLATKTDVD